MHVNLFRSIVAFSSLCGQEGVKLDLLVTEGESAITRGRSNLAATFLRQTDCRTLVMIDADILIQPQDLLNLVRLQKPIRGAAVSLKTRDHSECLSVYKDGKRLQRAEMPAEPFEVDYIGGAVMLVEREVIEALSAIPALAFDDPINGPGAHIFHEMIVDGALLSEDFAFCARAREHGFGVWCDPTVIVSHAGMCQWSA